MGYANARYILIEENKVYHAYFLDFSCPTHNSRQKLTRSNLVDSNIREQTAKTIVLAVSLNLLNYQANLFFLTFFVVSIIIEMKV